jgi:pimeloyl-ACP methyl ester carboxylesterase
MATYLLAHGAMHGGWCWQRLAPLLRARGHEVVTPTLTGLGERAHLLTPEVGPATHVSDLLQVLFYEDLSRVVLVGHSYAGMLIPAVAEQAPDRLASLVYLAAFVPRHGESMLDLEPPEAAAFYRHRARDLGDGWRVPPADAFVERWGVHDERDREWVGARLTAMPLKCLTDPLHLSKDGGASLPTAYIECTGPPLVDIMRPSAERARGNGWPVRTLESGHDAMLTAPRQLADLLLAVV